MHFFGLSVSCSAVSCVSKEQSNFCDFKVFTIDSKEAFNWNYANYCGINLNKRDFFVSIWDFS